MKNFLTGICIGLIFCLPVIAGSFNTADAHYYKPTPTPTPSCAPTPSLTPPVVSIEATLTPTPTVNVTNTFTTQTQIGTAASANNTGGPVCSIQIKPPTTPVFTRVDATDVNFAWWASTDNADSQAINYGLSPDSLIYGAILDSTIGNYTIGDLPPNHVIYAQICAYKNGCAACTPVIDP
jgi:hypothetical protein